MVNEIIMLLPVILLWFSIYPVISTPVFVVLCGMRYDTMVFVAFIMMFVMIGLGLWIESFVFVESPIYVPIIGITVSSHIGFAIGMFFQWMKDKKYYRYDGKLIGEKNEKQR